MSLGSRIRLARKAAGLSVKQLAEQIGLAPTTIYDLERGDKKGSTKLPRMARALGVSAIWLQDGEGDCISEPKFDPRKTSQLSDGERRLLDVYDKLSASDKAVAERVLVGLASSRSDET